MDAKKEPEYRRLAVEVVQPALLQRDWYDECSAGEEAAFVSDVRRNGQRDRAHVLPPGNAAGWPPFSLLDGHRRAAALKQLGAAEIDVVVRWDLLKASAAEVEQTFIQFNLNRRQLHPLDRAAAVLRMFEIQKGKPHGGVRHSVYESEARERVAKSIGWSGRHLLRMFRILLTPREVQRAVRDRHLPVVLAEKVEGLPPDVQQEIANRLGELDDLANAKRVVATYVGVTSGRHRLVGDALASFARSLTAALSDLGDRADQVSPRLVAEVVPALRRGKDLITRLLERAGDGR